MAVTTKTFATLGMSIATTVAGAGTAGGMIGDLAGLPPALLGFLIFFVWITTFSGAMARHAMIANQPGMDAAAIARERRKAIGLFLAQFLLGCLTAIMLKGDLVKIGGSCIMFGWLGPAVFDRIARMTGVQIGDDKPSEQ